MDNAPLIGIQIEPSKSLPRINQHSINKEAIQGIKPITEDDVTQGLIIPCTGCPCNTPVLPVRKPKGWKWRFVQDLHVINNIVIPQHPVIPSPHTLLASIPTASKVFTATDSCSAFLHIPLDIDSQYLLPLLGKKISSPEE